MNARASFLKTAISRILGQENIGRLDFLLNRHAKTWWGSAFNGQEFRCRIYRDVINSIKANAIVETGTFCGTTTELFAQSGLPVYSVESDPRAYGYATLRLRRYRDHVHLYHASSPEFLRELANMPEVPKFGVFFYLDAHSGLNLPLIAELTLIYDHWTKWVVMIDDFEVPGSAYGCNDYGPAGALNLDLLGSLKFRNVYFYFPAIDAERESGGKRGCVVMCEDEGVADALSAVESLKRYSPSGR